jgi:hypothetical protein
MKFLPHVTLSVTLTIAVTVPLTVNRIHSDDRSLFHAHQYTTHTTIHNNTQQCTATHNNTQQHTIHSNTQQYTTHNKTPLHSSLIRLQNITEHLKITIKQTNQSFTPAWP